jgi:hypothetical protein
LIKPGNQYRFQFKGMQMKFNRALPLMALIASVAFVQGADAQQTPPTAPSIHAVHAECTVSNNQTYTVRVDMAFNSAANGPYAYRYSFRNSATGQNSIFYTNSNNPNPWVGVFPLQSGKYELMVAWSQKNVANAPPLPGVAVALYDGIRVPVTVLTPGIGSGCRFSIEPDVTLQKVPTTPKPN